MENKRRIKMSKECQLKIAKSNCKCRKCKSNIKKEDMCFLFENNKPLCTQCAIKIVGKNMENEVGLLSCMKNYNKCNSEKA